MNLVTVPQLDSTVVRARGGGTSWELFFRAKNLGTIIGPRPNLCNLLLYILAGF